MFDYVHDRMSHQSIYIRHRAEAVKQGEELLWTEVCVGDWSVYPLEPLRQSAAVLSHSHRGVAKQTDLSYLGVSNWVPVKHSPDSCTTTPANQP